MKITEFDEFNNEIENCPQLFTTGAFISPRKINIDGKVYWFWVVDGFEDNSFYDGDVLNPLEFSETKEGLFAEIDDEYE